MERCHRQLVVDMNSQLEFLRLNDLVPKSFPKRLFKANIYDYALYSLQAQGIDEEDLREVEALAGVMMNRRPSVETFAQGALF